MLWDLQNSTQDRRISPTPWAAVVIRRLPVHLEDALHQATRVSAETSEPFVLYYSQIEQVRVYKTQ